MVNLEMNTLEDAFINIGMEEDKFIKNRKSNVIELRKSLEEKFEAKYTDFHEI